MDYLRLAKSNRILDIEKLAELPCDMGFVGVEGGDHPFLYAQAGARGEDGSHKPTWVPIGGLAVPPEYESSTEFSLYQNEPNGRYTPHGEGYHEDDYPGEEDDWEWEDPDLDESESSESGSSSSSSSSSSGEHEPVYSKIPIINDAIKARKELIKEEGTNAEDYKAWFNKSNCQRLGFWMDMPLCQAEADYDAEALKALRWGWFRPVRLSPDWEATPYPAGTRLVGRPLVGGYNKTWILPPPDEGWSEEWQKERDKWQMEHPGEDPEPMPWESYWQNGVWHPADLTLRQKNEFGRCPVLQRAFGGRWKVDWDKVTYETEEEEPDESSSSDSDSSSSIEWPADWQDEGDPAPKKRKETVYIGKTELPNPGFDNPYRGAEQWAMAPLRECEGPDPMGTSFKIADYDEVWDLEHGATSPEIIEAQDPDAEDPVEDASDIPSELKFHHLKKGEYDWRFLCGFTERRKHIRERQKKEPDGDGEGGDESGEEEDTGPSVTHTVRHQYYPLWWGINDPKEGPVTPLSDAALMAEISWWAHCVKRIPWGTRIDVRIIAHVYSMKISEAIANKLRSKGWTRVAVNVAGQQPKNGREWWHTHTVYEVRVRQHLPLK